MISPQQESKARGCSLSLYSLTPAGSRAKHLGDGISGKHGKGVRGRTDGELVDGLLHFVGPNGGGGPLCDTDVGVPVEHLADRDEVLIPAIVTGGMSKVRST